MEDEKINLNSASIVLIEIYLQIQWKLKNYFLISNNTNRKYTINIKIHYMNFNLRKELLFAVYFVTCCLKISSFLILKSNFLKDRIEEI